MTLRAQRIASGNMTCTVARAPKVLISHPTGNQNVRNAVLGLSEREMLAEFWTTVAWNSTSLLASLLPSRMKAQLERRSFDRIPNHKIHCVPTREVMRLALSNAPMLRPLCSGERAFSSVGMYRHFDVTVSRRLKEIKPDAVYAYEGGALNTFREAKSLGISTIYELPSSYWHWATALFQQEGMRNPAFASLIPKLRDSQAHTKWKDEELSLADAVIVPSEHVRSTLSQAVPDSKIRVVPYGAPKPTPRPEPVGVREKLRVVFVGNLSQGKGISYLLQAVESLADRVELTLIGRRFVDQPVVDAACKKFRYLGSIPHSAVLREMLSADVLVLPSLAEGCALVVLEALACGLPVVVTPNAGVLGFVRDGVEGFVVPICSADAIAQKLNLLFEDRVLLRSMSQQAQQAAAANPWESYRGLWARVVREACYQ